MKAVLVGLQLTGVSEEDLESSLSELKRLVETLGFEVMGKLTQKRSSPSPISALGAGKLLDLALWTGGSGIVPTHHKTTGKTNELPDEQTPDLEFSLPVNHQNEDFSPPPVKVDKVIFDLELTPNQLRNLEQATGVEVLDRTGVIVEIFHRHAKTRAAKLQVEIARLNYLAPRLRASGAGERQGGGIGAKGIGETSYELDRRRIRDKVALLQQELESIQVTDAQRRSRRQEQLRVALVGYTNAGKSSLMRTLTGDEVLVADKLFATLDTTVRTLQPDIFPKILVSDTVGFIKKLPHDLIASFRSTLDEAGDASLLLYVVDAADPAFRSQLEVTQTVLEEIGAAKLPSLIILNKIDCLNIAETRLLGREFPNAVQISTRNPADILKLKNQIRELLTADFQEASLLVPYTDKTGILGEIRRSAAVTEEKHEETGVLLRIKTYPETLNRLKKLLPE